MMRRILPILLLLFAMVLTACSQDKGAVAGTYAAQSNETEIVLTLKDNGKGTWSTDLDEIEFKWSIRKGGELWLHTKEGGVIPGVISDDTITMILPGVDQLVFQRQ
ncbi:MAG: hypothetical protein OCC46_05845 [Pseudodesulfovibrio sp.]